MGYIYIINSFAYLKIGKTINTLTHLLQRYSTCYTEFDYMVFETHNSNINEIEQTILSKLQMYNIGGEKFVIECLDIAMHVILEHSFSFCYALTNQNIGLFNQSTIESIGDNNLVELIYSCIRNSNSIPQLLAYIIKDEIVLHNSQWYVWDKEHLIWKQYENHNVINYCKEKLVSVFMQVKRHYQDDYNVQQCINRCSAYVENKITSIVDYVKPQCEIVQFNSNLFLLPFKQQTFDLELNQIRPSVSNDRFSIRIEYEFPDSVDITIRAELLEFFNSIVPDQSVYFLKCLSSLLTGNELCMLMCFTGAEKSRTILLSLLEEAMGDYVEEIDINRSHPMSFKRIFLSYLNQNKINKLAVKKILKSQTSLILSCDKVPDFANILCDLKIIRFESFYRNITYAIIKRWAPQFMLLLTEYYQEFINEGIEEEEEEPQPPVEALSPQQIIMTNWISQHLKYNEGSAFKRSNAWQSFVHSNGRTIKQKVFYGFLTNYIGIEVMQISLLGRCDGWLDFELI